MKIKNRRKIQLSSQKGQSLTEFALALPILILMLFAVIQFGIIFNNYVTLTDATRAGARKGAVGRQLPDPTGAVVAAVRSSASDLKQSQLSITGHLAFHRRLGRDGHGDLPVLDQADRPARQERAAVEHDQGAGRMRPRSERGQATVLTAVFLVVMLGAAALVLDVGSWYRADRQAQSTADAAALAGAQALPYDTEQCRFPGASVLRQERWGAPVLWNHDLERPRAERHDQRPPAASGERGLQQALRRQVRHGRRHGWRARRPDGPGAVRRADRR